MDNIKIVLASMYLDINQHLGDNLLKIDAIIQHARGEGIILAMENNSRSTIWHDKQTNARGRILEEFLTSNQLHTLNEDSDYTTFSSTRGSSNIDLTIVNIQLLRTVNEWEIWDQDICSDHNIIRYTIGQVRGDNSAPRPQEPTYIVQRRNINKFQSKLVRLAKARICTTHKQEDTGDLDSTLAKLVTPQSDIEKTIDEFYENLSTACNKSFRIQLAPEKAKMNRSVPWWTDELTIMRKGFNALRRRYQRTTNNENLRTHRKAQYLEGKTRYASTIKNEKFSSWKAFCNLTPANNPRNEVYKLAAGKKKLKTRLTTLRKPNGTQTKDTANTLRHILEHFTPEDNNNDVDDYHRRARLQS